MGAVCKIEEEREQLAEVHRIHPDARKWLQHHFGNALAGAIGMLQIGNYIEAEKALDHAIRDLRQITPPEERIEIMSMNRQRREGEE